MAKKEVGRRGWIAGLVPTAVDAVVEGRRALAKSAQPPKPRRRPPGAVDEVTFLERCDGCGDCIEVCPHDSVFAYVETAGELARTPVLKPDKSACHMCEGFPCAASCPTGALLPVAEPTWWLGEVRISTEHCFTYRGPECGACAGLCPTDTPALRMRGLHPKVEAEHCVGCGLCIEACPTLPKAIELLAYRPRPVPTDDSTETVDETDSAIDLIEPGLDESVSETVSAEETRA